MSTVYKYAVRYRPPQSADPSTPQIPRSVAHAVEHLGRPLTPRGLALLVLFRPDDRSDKQRQLLGQARLLHPDLALAIQLAQEFAAMLRERDATPLAVGLHRVADSTLASLKSFGMGC